ncbi:MAG: WecB/TagA/CpsF family glycosyltransferase [Bacillota bacterium]|nr:WecB/TagA/CpsF family glycosyltransferase [Bacillota bacterium]
MEKINVAGLLVGNVTMSEAVDAVIKFAQDRTQPSVVVTPNAEIAKDALDNNEFLQTLNKADMIVPDGAGIVLAAKILGTPLKCKVAGCDLAAALLPELEKNGLSLFLFGSEPGVAEKAADNIKAKCPKLNICGTLNGFFKSDDDVIPTISAAKPDVLFVCLGAPKQEHFMFNNRDRLDVGVMLGLGGTVNVMAGTAQRAPEFFVKMNLEWFYRLLKEPKRFKRMLKLPAYIIEVNKMKNRNK